MPAQIPFPDGTDPTEEYLAGGERNGGSAIEVRVLSSASDDAARRFGPQLWDLMEHDPVISSTAAKLATAALKGGIHILPAIESPKGEEPTGDAAIAKEIADRQAAMIRDLEYAIEDLGREMILDAFAYGNKLAEVIEYKELVDGWQTIKSIKPKPWWAWRIAVTPTGTPFGIVPAVVTPAVPTADTSTQYDGPLVVGPVLSMDHVMLLAWDARSGDPRGRSLYRHIYVPWNSKTQTIPEYFLWRKRWASPSITIKMPANAPPVTPRDANGMPIAGAKPIEASVAAYQAALKWRNGGILMLPIGAEEKIQEPQGNGEAFLKGLDYDDRQIAQGIIHAARAVMEAEHGSKADASVGQDTSGSLEEWIGDWFARSVRKVLRENLRKNKGDVFAAKFTPKVQCSDIAQADRTGLVTAFGGVGWKPAPSQWGAIDAECGLPKASESSEERVAANAPPPKLGTDPNADPNADPAKKPGGKPKPGEPPAKEPK